MTEETQEAQPPSAEAKQTDADVDVSASPTQPQDITARSTNAQDDEDDEDEEPKLKYQRLVGTLSESLAKDAVSCMDVSDRFLAIGTHWGAVHMMDLMGTEVKRFQCHTASVNQVSIDTEGEYIASAGDDGNVVINSLYTSDTQTFNFRRPVKAVCLEPGYSRKQTRQFVSGGMAETVLLTGRGWFGNTNITLHSGEGPILAAAWRGTFIVWANETGVCVYDTATSQRFGKIERPPDAPRADLFRCSLTWKTDTILMIGWAESVKVVEIKDRSKQDIASGLTPKCADVTHQFRTDYVVSGVAPLGDALLLLSYITDLSPLRNIDVLDNSQPMRRQAQPPEVHIVDLNGTESANDVLSVLGYEHFQATDYRLVYLASPEQVDVTYYIVSPKDIVVARPRGLDDRIEWLVERKRYGEALRVAETAGSEFAGQSKVNMILDIGQKYISSLMSDGNYREAAASCPKLLRTNVELWEQWINKFAESGHLQVITPFLPLEDPQLSPASYELVLMHYLNTDVESLLQIIRVWPATLYRVASIIEAVHAVYAKDPENVVLIEILLELSERNKQWDMVLQYGLRIYRPNVLELVVKHNLFQVLESHALLVMNYDQHMIDRMAATGGSIPPPPEAMHIPESTMASPTSRAADASESMSGSSSTKEKRDGVNAIPSTIRHTRASVGAEGVQLMAMNTDRILPYHVTQQLQGHDRYLHIYLDALFIVESTESARFHPMQIELYAEYDYPRLLPFLRHSTHYSVPQAFEICESRDLVPEMVYLLGKIGNSRRALMLIIERLGDVERAIQFAKEQNDQELWEEFLKYAMDKPAFIVGLLENLSGHMDPLRVIERIPTKLKIPGLKQALIKIMTDCSVQKSLRQGCEKILMSDTWESFMHLHRLQRRGQTVGEDTVCAMCASAISGSAAAVDEFISNGRSNADGSDVVVFFCRHIFHESCLGAGSPAAPVGGESSALSGVDRAVSLVYASGVGAVAAEGRGGSAWRAGLVCPLCRKYNSN